MDLRRSVEAYRMGKRCSAKSPVVHIPVVVLFDPISAGGKVDVRAQFYKSQYVRMGDTIVIYLLR